MEYLLSIFITNLSAVMAMMFAVWLLSLIKGDASIADIFWGLGFVVVAWLTFLQGRRLPRSKSSDYLAHHPLGAPFSPLHPHPKLGSW